MLKSLVIKNIALIDNAEIEFSKGLNVLSGETGAGKSVILESLNFVLGAKADKTLIRSGESQCLVTAEFEVSNNPLIKDIYNENDIEYDDCLIIQRKLTIDGKSSIKLNGESVNSTILRKFTALLVDVHGQSEHFHLLKNSNQLQLLDKFGGQEIENIKNKLKDEFEKLKAIKKELESLGGDETQRLLRLDILNYQIQEIERVGLKDGEEDELIVIRQKLAHHKKITDALSNIKSCLSDEGGICDLLSNVSRLSNTVSEYGEDYLKVSERLFSALSELDDISCEVSSQLEDFDLPDYNPNEIEDRLESIKTLKKKYGSNFAEISAFYENAKVEKDKLENFNILAENLLKQKVLSQKYVYEQYILLSNARKKFAKILSENVLEELKELGMLKAQFIINFDLIPDLSECKFDSNNGFDKIEFMFSANNGEPIKPLSYVISGGEMSRFMLSIKAQTAKYSEISTFIFDEIDAGISGITARIVAEKLAKISSKVQVVAITHLPQISAMADNNLLIEKNESGERTMTYVKRLSVNDKIFEISRLISGSPDSSSSIQHAKELIENANRYKINLKNKSQM